MPAAITRLVEWLRAAQVRVWIEGAELRYEAPAGALPAELLAEVEQRPDHDVRGWPES